MLPPALEQPDDLRQATGACFLSHKMLLGTRVQGFAQICRHGWNHRALPPIHTLVVFRGRSQLPSVGGTRGQMGLGQVPLTPPQG